MKNNLSEIALFFFCTTKFLAAANLWQHETNSSEIISYKPDHYQYDTNSSEMSSYKPELLFDGTAYLLKGQTFENSCSLPLICTGAMSACDIDHLRVIRCSENLHPNCIVQNTSLVNDKTISFLKSNISEMDTGTYFCQYNDSNKASFNLWVGYMPVGPVNISCVSHDLDDLSCSWGKSKEDENNPLPVWYQSYFIGSPFYGWFDCPHPQPSGMSPRDDKGCNVHSSKVNELYTFIMWNNYTLYINTTNAAGYHVTKHIIRTVEIVKLSPPTISLSHFDSNTVTLMLNQSSVLSVLFMTKGVIYQISYNSNGVHKTMKFKTGNSSSIFLLTELRPYTKYLLTIKNRAPETNGERYWGIAKPFHVMTLAAAPVAVPEIGGYSSHDGYIYIYVKPILSDEKFAENASYIISINIGSIPVWTFNVSWDVTTLTNVTCQLYDGLEVTFQTVNDVGYSVNTSKLIIPAQKSERALPTEVIVEGSRRNRLISWNNRENDLLSDLGGIFVFWCVGSDVICEKDLNWIIVPPYKTNVSVSTEIDDNLIFAVAFEYKDGYRTELTFPDCYFSSFNQAPSGVSVFSVIPKKGQLLVKLGEFCSKKYTSRPMTYTIYYKQTNEITSICDKTFETKTTQASLKEKDIILDNIRESANYSICLKVTMRGGQSSISGPTQAQALSQSSHDNKALTEVSIIVIIVSVCVVLVCFPFIACKLRRKWRAEKPAIDLPQIKMSSKELKIVNSSDSGVASDTNSDSTQSNIKGQKQLQKDSWPELVNKVYNNTSDQQVSNGSDSGLPCNYENTGQSFTYELESDVGREDSETSEDDYTDVSLYSSVDSLSECSETSINTASDNQGLVDASVNQGSCEASDNQGSVEASGNQGSGESSVNQGSGESSGNQGSGEASGNQGSGKSSVNQRSGESSGNLGSGESSGNQGSGESSVVLNIHEDHESIVEYVEAGYGDSWS